MEVCGFVRYYEQLQGSSGVDLFLEPVAAAPPAPLASSDTDDTSSTEGGSWRSKDKAGQN